MLNVYLIPCDDRVYHACVSKNAPDPSAIFMVKEGDYPVGVWWTRHDMNMDRLWATDICENRENLVKLLNFLGECGHVIEELWEYKDSESTNEALSNLFDICYERKMEQLGAAIDEMYADMEDEGGVDYAGGVLITPDEDDENFPF